MTALTLLIIAAMLPCGCAAPKGFLGVQRVTGFHNIARGRETDNCGPYFLLMFPAKDTRLHGLNFQVEPFTSFSGRNYGVRFGADVQLF